MFKKDNAMKKPLAGGLKDMNFLRLTAAMSAAFIFVLLILTAVRHRSIGDECQASEPPLSGYGSSASTQPCPKAGQANQPSCGQGGQCAGGFTDPQWWGPLTQNQVVSETGGTGNSAESQYAAAGSQLAAGTALGLRSTTGNSAPAEAWVRESPGSHV